MSIKKQDLLFLGLAALVYAIVQVLISSEVIAAFWQLNIILMLINIILAVSLNLINGFTGQFSIGHAGFMAIGAYMSAVITLKWHLSFVCAILGGMLLSGIAGILIGLPTLRLKGDYLAIVTLGFGEIIRISILNIPYIGGASGMNSIPRLTTFALAFWAAVFTIWIIKNLINSRHGRACISVRENEIAAESVGVDTTGYKVLAFTVGAVFAGLAGSLFAHYFYLVHPASFTFMRSFDILTMIVLGGLGSISGSVIAAVFVTLFSAALASYPEWRMIVYSLMLIVVMIYRPQGLLGKKEFGKVLWGCFSRGKKI